MNVDGNEDEDVECYVHRVNYNPLIRYRLHCGHERLKSVTT